MNQSTLPPCFFIFGFGYTAQFVAQKLLELNFQVIGTTRDPKKVGDAEYANYTLVDFNEAQISLYLSRATHILVSVPPAEQIGDPVLRHFCHLFSTYSAQIQWLGYLSSTSVYGDYQGAWVDENSFGKALQNQGQLRLDAEKAWLSFCRKQGLPLHILRLAGIYGPRRNALERILAGKKASIYKPGQYFSRIHVADISAVILASIKHPHPYAIYNVADDEPTASHLVDAYAAKLLKRPPLPLVAYEAATMSPMERQFYNSNRRVSNEKIKQELQIKLRYPSYREGLAQLFKEDYEGKM